jgi:hypothetical protein
MCVRNNAILLIFILPTHINNDKLLFDFILHLLSGKGFKICLDKRRTSRTKIIGRFLDKKTAYQNIFELDGGINRGWIDKGLATTKTDIH